MITVFVVIDAVGEFEAPALSIRRRRRVSRIQGRIQRGLKRLKVRHGAGDHHLDIAGVTVGRHFFSDAGELGLQIEPQHRQLGAEIIWIEVLFVGRDMADKVANRARGDRVGGEIDGPRRWRGGRLPASQQLAQVRIVRDLFGQGQPARHIERQHPDRPDTTARLVIHPDLTDAGNAVEDRHAFGSSSEHGFHDGGLGNGETDIVS